ncbi:hypothetical protein [Streptomyces lavendofoliae]|uniref:hypothetical protein n=1 Tax=Streptomyces lavendofoliae TaxID=67314 RepID=UPI003D90DB8D
MEYCLVFACTRKGKTLIETALASSSVADCTADVKNVMDRALEKWAYGSANALVETMIRPCEF